MSTEEKKSDLSPAMWDQVVKAIETNDKAKLKEIGDKLGYPRIVQEAVSVAEVKQQIMQMAPGTQENIGGFILDLAEKL